MPPCDYGKHTYLFLVVAVLTQNQSLKCVEVLTSYGQSEVTQAAGLPLKGRIDQVVAGLVEFLSIDVHLAFAVDPMGL